VLLTLRGNLSIRDNGANSTTAQEANVINIYGCIFIECEKYISVDFQKFINFDHAAIWFCYYAKLSLKLVILASERKSIVVAKCRWLHSKDS
jgi:hypothetical protein